MQCGCTAGGAEADHDTTWCACAGSWAADDHGCALKDARSYADESETKLTELLVAALGPEHMVFVQGETVLSAIELCRRLQPLDPRIRRSLFYTGDRSDNKRILMRIRTLIKTEQVRKSTHTVHRPSPPCTTTGSPSAL